MFIAIATSAVFGEWLTIFIPAKKQIIRRIVQASVGGTLFIGLSLYGGVHFQFTQIVFGCFGGIVTGALIQFIITRIILPFFMGNSFCSRACWDGAIFELVQDKIPKAKKPRKRNEVIAWSYLFGLILIRTIVSSINNPAIVYLQNILCDTPTGESRIISFQSVLWSSLDCNTLPSESYMVIDKILSLCFLQSCSIDIFFPDSLSHPLVDIPDPFIS